MKAMPFLREKVPQDGRAVSKILEMMTRLPPDVIRRILENVPQEDQREIMVLLANENRDRLRRVLSKFLEQRGIDISLDEITLNSEMCLCMTVSNLNYMALAEKYLPLVRDSAIMQESPVSGILGTLLRIPGMLLYTALDRIPQDKKDEAVVYLIQQNKDRIGSKIEKMMAEQNIRIRLGDLQAEI